MINKSELQYAIDSVCIYILDEVISPFCGIPKGTISCDVYLTEIYEFLEDEDLAKGEKIILKTISRKYQLPLSAPEYLEDLPLAEIALYVLTHGKYNDDYKGVE